ncbi:hypothetical protein AGIG_G11478 [Arapaima gigas]
MRIHGKVNGMATVPPAVSPVHGAPLSAFPVDLPAVLANATANAPRGVTSPHCSTLRNAASVNSSASTFGGKVNDKRNMKTAHIPPFLDIFVIGCITVVFWRKCPSIHHDPAGLHSPPPSNPHLKIREHLHFPVAMSMQTFIISHTNNLSYPSSLAHRMVGTMHLCTIIPQRMLPLKKSTDKPPPSSVRMRCGEHVCRTRRPTCDVLGLLLCYGEKS